MISINAIIPITVENIPKLLDLVQPTKAIMIAIETIPIKKEIIPKLLGNIRSLLSALKGNPSVVIIKTLVMAKIDTKNVPVAKIENRNIFVLILSEAFLSNNRTSTVSENPHSSALINCIWLANLFMYSNESSIIFNSRFSYPYDNSLKAYLVKSKKHFIV